MSQVRQQHAETVSAQVAWVIASLRRDAAGHDRFALTLLAHDTHDEYRFAVENPDLVTIIPAWQGEA
jgi:hypothetical protein